MSTYENYSLILQAVGIIFSFIATICSIAAIIFTYKNLKEIKNQFFVLLLKEKKKIDNFLTTKSVYDTIFSSS